MGSLGEFRGRLRAALGHRSVEPEAIAHHDQNRAHGGTDVGHHLAQKLLQLRLVDCRRHLRLPPWCRAFLSELRNQHSLSSLAWVLVLALEFAKVTPRS